MRRLKFTPIRSAIIVLGLAVSFMSAPAVHAEDAIPSALEASSFTEYIDLWKLTIEVMGRELELFMNIADVEGKVGATLDSAQSAEPLAITEILAAEGGGLDMNSELKFGGSFTIDIIINLMRDGDGLTGRIRDKGGIFDAEIVGTPASQEELDSVQGKRPAPTEARSARRARYAGARLPSGSAGSV